MSGPLSGIVVLEVGHVLAGPYCGMLLADLGAEVIKIEPPEGDIARRISPHRIGPHNAYFASLNRSKKSVVLDLQDADDRSRFVALARGADVVVESFTPGTMDALGLGASDLQTLNPITMATSRLRSYISPKWIRDVTRDIIWWGSEFWIKKIHRDVENSQAWLVKK